MKVTVVRGRATDSAVYKLADSLASNGLDVTLLVWDRQQDLKSIPNKNYKLDKFNLKAPYDNWAVYLYLPIWSIYELIYLLTHDFDVIHACDIDTEWPAIIVKTIKRKKLFYTMFDFYANCIPSRRPYLITNAIRAIIGGTEKFGIRFADVLFLPDECRSEEIRGAKINRLYYIYNSPPDRYVASDGNGRTVNDELVIFYAGAMHRYRGMEFMIEAVKDLDGVKLVLAGPESDVAPYKDAISKSNGKIQYLGWLPTYEDVLRHTMDADILFRFNDPQIIKSKYESPNKLFEAMMCRKPIIMNIELAAGKIIADSDCGLLVHYGDVDALKKAIIQLKNDAGLRMRLGTNGRKAYTDMYSWRIMEHRLIEAYDYL